MTKVVVYLGPARSGKTHELVRPYRAALRRRPGERVLWLAPNAQTANMVRGQVLAEGLDACFWPGVVTFDRLSDKILADTFPPRRPISRLLQRELLRRAVRRALDDGKLVRLAAAAVRAGFIDLLAEHIQELQRRDIRPAAYRMALPTRGDPQQHGELAHLYAAYVGQLAEHGLVDLDGAHLAARDALAAGTCRRFQALDVIVADGFTDFTRTQHDILRLLAPRTKQLLISLPDDGSRPDLFAKVSATLAELRHHHPKLEVLRFAPRPSAWPAVGYLGQHIFCHPTQVSPPSAEVIDTLDRLEIVEAAGAHDEILEIARRVKYLLTREKGTGPFSSQQPASAELLPKMDLSPFSAGTRPSEIVVVFRSLADVAQRVREVFDQVGIPYYLESNPLLVTTPVVRTLLALLRLDAEDWSFRRVISVLTNTMLTALDEGARQAADWLVRDLQIAQGRAALLQRVAQLAADATSPGQSEYAERRSTQAQRAKPLLDHLANALDNLPQEATLAEWCQALARAGSALGLSPFNQGWHAQRLSDGRGESGQVPRPSRTQGVPPADEPNHATDVAAWQSIERHFAALQRLDDWLGQPPRRWSRGELIGALLDAATHESLAAAHDDVGRVRILSAPAARNLTAKHLFIAGMSEQAFPMPERAARLATEADYRNAARVADEALATTPIDSATRSQEEMLLFYEVLSRAEESLTISYPALDDKAQTLPPSPYVLEIERLIGEQAMERVRRSTPHLSPVPRDGCVSSLADWRVKAVSEALDGDRRLLAGLFSSNLPAVDERGEGRVNNQPLANAIDAGIRIVHARARGDSFGPAEGLLTSPAVATRLAKRFGEQHLWSPSQWETYAACPFKFYLHVVLGLEPLGDLVLETDFARRGSRLHHVLAKFHREWPTICREQSLTVEEESARFLGHLHKTIDERIAASSRAGIDAALLELDRRQIRKWAAGHFDHHQSYHGACAKLGGQMTPRHFEFRFGPRRQGETDQDPESTGDAFLLDLGGEQIRITGQIDRIDVATIEGKTFFSVIDYKSGKKVILKQQHIESGERLQLPIYVEAAQMLVFGGEATPLAAGYWSMAGGFDAKGALAVVQEDENGDRWETMKDTVRRLVRQFVDGIRHGDFPVDSRDDKCTSYCEFNTVCRVGQIRNLNKTRSR